MSSTALTKRQQILDGAKQEFLAQGFAATSVDRIAAAAGVSKATIYSHFQGKEGLFKALVEQMAQQRFQELDQSLLKGESPREVLRHIAEDFFRRTTHEPEFQALHRVLIGESDRFPHLSCIFIQDMVKPVMETLTRFFQNHQQTLKVADPEATARIFAGSIIHFAIVQEIMHGKEMMPMAGDRLIAALIDLIAPEDRI